MGSMSATPADDERKYKLTFSSFNNQVSCKKGLMNAWCPGMTTAVLPLIKVVVTEAGTQLKSVRIGISDYAWDAQTMVKWKLDDGGTAADLLESSPNPLATCEMSFRNLSVGFSFHVLPSRPLQTGVMYYWQVEVHWMIVESPKVILKGVAQAIGSPNLDKHLHILLGYI